MVDTDGVGDLLEQIAPPSLAESWDNVGWQVRVPGQEVRGVLLALEVTSAVLDEALEHGCNLIFSHHPLLFKPLKSLDLGSPPGDLLAWILQVKVSVWAAHTNLDVMPEGTSFALAKAVGLGDVGILAGVDRKDFKLVVYVPPDHADAVKSALAKAGAGRIGDYSHCFWQTLGTGQFMPETGASPYLGAVGEVEKVQEFRVEAVVPESNLGPVLRAMRGAHPYEEVAYDLLPLANRVSLFGYGAVGSLARPATTARIARESSERLGSVVCQVAGNPGRTHRRVAVMGGSGASYLGEAARSGSTLFITSDVRYHDSQEAVARGLDVVILDHFATERPVLETTRARLEQMLPGVPMRVASTSTTPFVKVRR